MADKQSKTANETHFRGLISGQIHAGSGNINIGHDSEGAPNENKTVESVCSGAAESDLTVSEAGTPTPAENRTLFHGPVSGQIHTGSGDININRIIGDTQTNNKAISIVHAGVDANGDVVVVEPETQKVVAKVPQQEAYQRLAEEADDVRRQKQQIYDQNCKLAKQWAFFSLFAGILGFLIILGGIVALLVGKGNATTGIITSIAGIIPEAAAALFFRQAEAAHKRVNENQKELIETGTAHRFIALVETIDDSETQHRLKEKMIMQMLGLSAKGQEIPAPISSKEKQSL
jgi:hypothetical protein